MKKCDELLIAALLSSAMYSIAYPIVHTTIISNINSQWLSLSSLISCLITIFVSKLWIKKSDKLYWLFPVFLIIEAISYTLIVLLFVLGIESAKVYYICDSILLSAVTMNIQCGGNKLRALRYDTPEKRETYDNKVLYVCNIASVIGYTLGTFVTFPTTVGFLLMLGATIVDNFFYFGVYMKNKRCKNE